MIKNHEFPLKMDLLHGELRAGLAEAGRRRLGVGPEPGAADQRAAAAIGTAATATLGS